MNYKNDKQHIQELLLNKPQNYAEAKINSQFLDTVFGFECESIEKSLHGKYQEYSAHPEKQLWQGLDVQSMQTPYSELVEMIDYLDPKPESTWVDLGAAYGRLGLVLGFLRSEVRFIGYEFVPERVIEAQRVYRLWHLHINSMVLADIASEEFILPAADIYFIYDFGSKKEVYLVLEKLRLMAQKKSFSIIARGRGIKNWILMEYPWLNEIHEPKHFLNWSVFRP